MEYSSSPAQRPDSILKGFERRRDCFNQRNLGAITLSARGKVFPIAYCSDDFVRNTSYSRQELLGEELRILQGPETCDKASDMLAWLFRNELGGAVYLYSYFNDRLPLPTKLQVTPLKEAGGQIRAVAIEFSLDPWGLAAERLAA